MSMTVEEARAAVESTRRAIESELSTLVVRLGPGWDVQLSTSWIDVTPMDGGRYEVPRVQIEAKLDVRS
jgi:hypothetical protein